MCNCCDNPGCRHYGDAPKCVSCGYLRPRTKKGIWKFVLVLAAIVLQLALLLAASLVLACDQYPTAPGTLVREYNGPNGLLYREFDTDKDNAADWGVAYQVKDNVPVLWPLFYAVGFDDPNYEDEKQKFTAVIVWQDKEVNGSCADIKQVYIRRNANKPLDMDTLEGGKL